MFTGNHQSVKNQCLAALVVSLMLINYGIISGWMSPTLPILTSAESPLPLGAITMDEATWVASTAAIGALPGNIIFGFVIKNCGRKWPLVASSIPLIISWLLVLFAQNVWYMYIGRLLQGFVIGGVLLTSPVYLVEIADDRIRGILLMTVQFAGSIGILLAFTLGSYTDFHVTPIYAIITSILFGILFSFFPETPLFLVRQNKYSEAENSLKFYRNIEKTHTAHIHNEIKKLKSIVTGVNIKNGDNKRLNWADFTTKPGRNAIIIVSVLVLLNQLSGITAMISYTETIFQSVGSIISPGTSAIIIGITQFIATLIVSPLIDRFGRRFLYIVSTMGTAFGLIAMAAYITLYSHGVEVQSFNWFPIVSFSYTVFVASWAIQALPISVSTEVLPDKLKEVGVTYAVSVLTITAFFIGKYFPLASDIIGYDGCFIFFATVCFVSGLFIIKFLPETKGKSYEEIMNSLS